MLSISAIGRSARTVCLVSVVLALLTTYLGFPNHGRDTLEGAGIRVEQAGPERPSDVTFVHDISQGKAIQEELRLSHAIPHGSLYKRITQQQYNDYVCKGDRLVHYMGLTAAQMSSEPNLPPSAAASQFTDYSDLSDNGWEIYPGLSVDSLFEYGQGWATVWDSLKLSDEGPPTGPNYPVQHQHEYSEEVNGKEYWVRCDETAVVLQHLRSALTETSQPTEAWYDNVYNPSEGYIIAANNKGPASMIADDPDLKDEHPDIVPPPLSQWSDVAFLEYQEQCTQKQQDIKRLSMIFQHTIINDITKSILEFAVPNPPQTLTADEAALWADKVTFDSDSEQGKAVLASPNGSGIAWLLIQHKEQLGHKKVSKVIVWGRTSTEGGGYISPNLMFELEDVT